MLSKLFPLFPSRRKSHALVDSNLSTYVYSDSADCSSSELVLFLLDLHMYVVPINQDQILKFPDPTLCIQYSFEPESSRNITRSVPLLQVLEIGFLENNFEVANKLRNLSDKMVLAAVRDLAILASQVTRPADIYIAATTTLLPQDGILACIDILLNLLNNSLFFVERDHVFFNDLILALNGLFFVLEKIGMSIGHSSTDVAKSQWTQTIGQAIKYIYNVAINVTSHNVNCQINKAEKSQVHGYKIMGSLVSILQWLANCVVIVREWCNPDTASTIALLYWSASDAVADSAIYLQFKDHYVVDATQPTDIESRGNAMLSLWQTSGFMSSVAHILYRCVSNTAPAPQDLLAGVGRMAGRGADSNSFLSTEISNSYPSESVNMLNWCTVAHTITGFKCLLRAAEYSATGDRLALPRQNEWVAAITESLIYCLEFGYKSRNLTLLAPVLAEVLFELCIRQSDCSLNVDMMFFGLAMHMSKFSEVYKRKVRRKNLKKKKSGLNNNLSKSVDSAELGRLSQIPSIELLPTGSCSIASFDPSDIKRAKSTETSSSKNKDVVSLTIDNFELHNKFNKHKLSRINTHSSSSFDGEVAMSEVGSVFYSESGHSPAAADAEVHHSEQRWGVMERLDELDTKVSSSSSAEVQLKESRTVVTSSNGWVSEVAFDIESTPKSEPQLPKMTPFPASKSSPVLRPGALTPLAENRSSKLLSLPGNRSGGSLDGASLVLSPDSTPDKNNKPDFQSIVGQSPQPMKLSTTTPPRSLKASVPHALDVEVVYTVGQLVDCMLEMKSGSSRWFSGKVEVANAQNKTYSVRFDDGELADNVSVDKIRVSKRSGRYSSRSPSNRSERTGSDRFSNSTKPSSTAPSSSSTLGSANAIPQHTADSESSKSDQSKIGNSPATSDKIITIPTALNKDALEIVPINDGMNTTPPKSPVLGAKSNSMSYSMDDEDTWRAARGAANKLSTFNLSSVADISFPSQDNFFKKSRDAADYDNNTIVLMTLNGDEGDGNLSVKDSDEDDGFTYTIPSVFTEAERQKRIQAAKVLVPGMNLDNVDMDVTAAMNGAAMTSLSGGILRDVDSTAKTLGSGVDDDGGESVGGSSNSDEQVQNFALADPKHERVISKALGQDNLSSNSVSASASTPEVVVAHYVHETDSDLLDSASRSHSKDSTFSSNPSLPYNATQLKRVPSLNGLNKNMAQSGPSHFENNILGSFNMSSKLQPPRPHSVPNIASVQGKNEAVNQNNKDKLETSSVMSANSLTSNSEYNGGLDSECRRALQRAYDFIALTLIERSVAVRARIEEKFCRQEETVTTNRSRNSSYRHRSDLDLSLKDSVESAAHRNVLYAVREYLETPPGKRSFPSIAACSTLVDPSACRLLKLLSDQFFDSCIPAHMESAIRLAEGAFGNVYSVICPSSCFRCYSHRGTRAITANESVLDDSNSLSSEYKPQKYAIKRVSRERSVYDMPVIVDIYSEITCLEVLAKHKGVCKLYNYGVQGGEYWLVMEEGRQDLSAWRGSLSSQNRFVKIRDIETCLSLFEDACVIVKLVHEAGIVHFDLKCSNFLLRGDPEIAVKWHQQRRIIPVHSIQPSGVLFLADFGESSIIKNNLDGSSLLRVNNDGSSVASPKRGGPTVLTSPKFRSLLKEELWPGIDIKRARGTLFVQSPEMLKISSTSKSVGLPVKKSKAGIQTNAKDAKEKWIVFPSPSYASDVWSLGCMLVELLTTSTLFCDRPWSELYCLLCIESKKDDIAAMVAKSINDFAKNVFPGANELLVSPVLEDIKKFLQTVLIQHPTDRPTMPDLINALRKIEVSSRCSSAPPTADYLSNIDASSVDSWEPLFENSRQLRTGQDSAKGQNGQDLRKASSRYHVEEGFERKSRAVSAPPKGKLYNDVCHYLTEATDSLDNVKMNLFSFQLCPVLFVSLCSSQDNVFSYDIGNAAVVASTASPASLYEFDTSNLLGESMNRVRNLEMLVSLSSQNCGVLQKAVGFLQKDRRLIEIVLVSEEPRFSNGVEGDDSTAVTGCFSFRLKKVKKSDTGSSASHVWVPWRSHKSKKVHVVTEDTDDSNEMRRVYKFNFGMGDPDRFLEVFKQALLFACASTKAGNTVSISVTGKIGGHSADVDATGLGSSRWTICNDGPGPALSARTASFESHARHFFGAEGGANSKFVKNNSVRSIATSKDGENSVGTKLSSASGVQRAAQAEFTRPLVSAASALAAMIIVRTNQFSSFQSNPILVIEKVSPWLLRGCQRETVQYLISYSTALLPFCKDGVYSNSNNSP